jgi:hypothetical protein
LEIDVEDEELSAATGGQEEAESSFSSSSPSFPTPTSLPVDPASASSSKLFCQPPCGKRKAADKTTLRTGYTSKQLKDMSASAFRRKSGLDSSLDSLQSTISKEFNMLEYMMLQREEREREREEREREREERQEREDRRREEREREREERDAQRQRDMMMFMTMLMKGGREDK